MIIIEEKDSGTITVDSGHAESVLPTTSRDLPRPNMPLQAEEDIIPRIGPQTEARIRPEDRGDEEARNAALVAGEGHVEAAPEPGLLAEIVSVRSDHARELLRQTDQLVERHGDVALTAEVQILKHMLSKCHDDLGPYPSESNFLSLLTLVESSMTGTRWKDYPSEQLETIRRAFEVGYRQTSVSFDDYESIRRAFASAKIETGPRIDLESLDMRDSESEEE